MPHLKPTNTSQVRNRLCRILATAVAALAIGGGFAGAPSAYASRDSVLANGDFSEDKNGDQWPDGWTHAQSGGSWISEEGGSKFLRLQSPDPGQMVMVHQQIPVPAGAKAMQLSFRARISNLKPGKSSWFDARIIINFKDAAGGKLKGGAAPYFRKDTNGWVEKTVNFAVPEGAATLEIMPSLFQVQTGTLDLDDLKLKAIDPAVVEAELAKAREKAPPQDPAPEAAQPEKFPPELFVVGNRLETKDGKHVWLQGVNIMSLDWNPRGEAVLNSAKVALEQWNAKFLRLAVSDEYWFGQKDGQTDGGAAYRALVDGVINLAANRGAYVLLDLHRYRAPKAEYAEFWKDAATRYKNHPAVIFDIMNEPHGTTWEVWRNGGFVEERKTKADEDAFLNPEDREKAKQGFESIGMQGLVDAVRSTGAKNIIAAGGLDWAYDLSGIVNGYALEEKGGNGIMYSTHIYNWKKGWESKVLVAAEKYPIVVGEVGADVKKMNFIPAEAQEDPYTWGPDMIGLIQKYKLNWTAFSFHPGCTPVLISDWKYTPTPFWGEPVKKALNGQQFEVKKLR